MTERERQAKLAELDRLLNDLDTRFDPARVWALLSEIAPGASAPPQQATDRAAQR